jgi:hypothetical protein
MTAMTQASSRTLIMLTAMLAFSFGGGMIGGYFGSMHVNREHAAETERLQVNVDRVSVATVNAIASLATDTEIVAADIVEISNRLDALEVKASDMSKSMSVRAGK